VIARYRKFLPVSDSTPIISLGEGGTPLIFSPRLSAIVGRDCEVYLKYEGLNPTGSFKDRGMTVAVSKAAEHGAGALICASTGNTSASAAAYAARAGLRCVVVLPAGKIATGKLVQAYAYGAKVIAIDGNFDEALVIVRELGERPDFAIVNSINPDRIAGQMTGAFEIVDDRRCARSSLAASRQRGKPHGVLGRVSRISARRQIRNASRHDWVSGFRRRSDFSQPGRPKSRDGGLRDSNREHGKPAGNEPGGRRFQRSGRYRHRR